MTWKLYLFPVKDGYRECVMARTTREAIRTLNTFINEQFDTSVDKIYEPDLEFKLQKVTFSSVKDNEKVVSWDEYCKELKAPFYWGIYDPDEDEWADIYKYL